MTRLTTIMLIVFTTLILALAACGKRSNPLSLDLKSGTSAASAAGERAPRVLVAPVVWRLSMWKRMLVEVTNGIWPVYC
jgi:ABC-type uncharacterized transport system auxiliary subunit